MSRPEPIECIVMSAITSETKASGKVRKVTLLLTNDEPDHPFAGLVGERLHIVALNVGDDETTRPIQKLASSPVRPGLDADEGAGSVPPLHDPAPAPKRKWSELPPAQQAAIRLSEPDFWEYLGKCVRTDIPDAEKADEALKWYFGIASKTTLNSPDFSERWRRFDNMFLLRSKAVA